MDQLHGGKSAGIVGSTSRSSRPVHERAGPPMDAPHHERTERERRTRNTMHKRIRTNAETRTYSQTTSQTTTHSFVCSLSHKSTIHLHDRHYHDHHDHHDHHHCRICPPTLGLDDIVSTNKQMISDGIFGEFGGEEELNLDPSDEVDANENELLR